MKGVIIFLAAVVVMVALGLMLLPRAFEPSSPDLRAAAPDSGAPRERELPSAPPSPPFSPEPPVLDPSGADARRKAAPRPRTSSAAVRQRPSEPELPSVDNPALAGIELSDADSSELARLKVPAGETGVLVKAIDPASAAVEAGLHEGDVIVKAQHDKVTSTDSLRRSIGSRDYTLLTIYREGNAFQLVLQTPYRGAK